MRSDISVAESCKRHAAARDAKPASLGRGSANIHIIYVYIYVCVYRDI